MQYYPKPLFILNVRCGDEMCGNLHPDFIECEEIGLMLWNDAPEALVAIIQRKKDAQTSEPVWVATILPPYSFGHDPDDRLVVIANEHEEGQKAALVVTGDDLDIMKQKIYQDQGNLHRHFFGDGKDDLGIIADSPPIPNYLDEPEAPSVEEMKEVDPTDLENLDPKRMFKA